MNTTFKIYNHLYKKYGPQGWWPLIDCSLQENGYHPNDYSFPKNTQQIFEVCLGSILTQNTTFTSVTKSLQNLYHENALDSQKIRDLPIEKFKILIKPSGYFNQKAEYILNFIDFFHTLKNRIPLRSELLNLRGIGPETADSILLFAYNQAEFKVDAYTNRLFSHYGLIDKNAKYDEIKNFIETQIKEEIQDKQTLVHVYQEFHALIVAHSKKFYSKKPYGVGCFLVDIQNHL